MEELKVEKETVLENDELKKSIDELTDSLFKGYSAGKKYPKNIDIYKDSEKTADEAVGKVKKSPNDESRGAGRPAAISDVPDTDEDGKRDSKGALKDISCNDGVESEPDETKQSPSLDQTVEKYRLKSKPKAPEMRPFTKSEDFGEIIDLVKAVVSETLKVATPHKPEKSMVEISESDFSEYQELKKSKEAIVAEPEKLETLKKSELQEQNELLQKSLDVLSQKSEEQNILLQKIASRPVTSKSITSINALEKSVAADNKTEAFSKAEVGDAIEALVKSSALPDTALYEYDFNGTIYDKTQQALVEEYLHSK